MNKIKNTVFNHSFTPTVPPPIKGQDYFSPSPGGRELVGGDKMRSFLFRRVS